MKKLLLIDDDEGTLLTVGKYLSKSGYSIISARNGEEGIKILEKEADIALVVVDVVMPIMDGVEFCRKMRENLNLANVPILMLTAMSDITDKYVGFDAGADDYLTKPFAPLELLLRVKSLLKRSENQSSISEEKVKAEVEKKEFKENNYGIEINKDNYSVIVNNKSVYLTSIEFDLLVYLYENQGKPISAEEILFHVMKYPPNTGSPQTIRTHVKNLRAKIEVDAENPKFITTIPKRGYMFGSN